MSCGGVVFRDGRLLLVHHKGVDAKGPFDFWVGPGGRLEGEESILDCAQRETFEETGVNTKPLRIAYIEEFVEGDYHFCKFWVLCEDLGGELTQSNEPPNEHMIVAARFVERSGLEALTLFPDAFRDVLWEDHAAGFPTTRYLGLSRIE